MEDQSPEKTVLPHHIQQDLCTTRLPYRQGRKLTSVKVYTINNESKHLLVFGVPSLNLRQESKTLFSRYGKITQFVLSPKHTIEKFTETYHAVFHDIRSARKAKLNLDNKNFYGGVLHVCYAPEFESLSETKSKLDTRRFEVNLRLKNLAQEHIDTTPLQIAASIPSTVETQVKKLDMSVINTISINGSEVKKNYKRKCDKTKVESKRQCFNKEFDIVCGPSVPSDNINTIDNNIEVIDCTMTDKEVITNVNEEAEQNVSFKRIGREEVIVKKVPPKAVNVIKFNINR